MNIFPIAPAESRYLWFLIPVIIILLGAMVLVATSVRGAQSSSFEIRPEGLRLRGDLYGRLIPKAQLRLNLVRRVDLTREQDLRPKWRRLGTGLPGYQAGWFRLRNGDNRARCWEELRLCPGELHATVNLQGADDGRRRSLL